MKLVILSQAQLEKAASSIKLIIKNKYIYICI